MVILDNVPNGAQCLYSHTEAVLWNTGIVSLSTQVCISMAHYR